MAVTQEEVGIFDISSRCSPLKLQWLQSSTPQPMHWRLASLTNLTAHNSCLGWNCGDWGWPAQPHWTLHWNLPGRPTGPSVTCCYWTHCYSATGTDMSKAVTMSSGGTR
eukprot:747828-Rhodomonas_salina.1